MEELKLHFGTLPPLSHKMQPLNFIMNCLPRSEMKLLQERGPIYDYLYYGFFEKLTSLRSYPVGIFDNNQSTIGIQ